MDIENGNLKIIFQKISYTNINENKPDKDKNITITKSTNNNT